MPRKLKNAPETLDEYDAVVAKVLATRKGRKFFKNLGKKGQAAAEQVMKDARVTPEQMRRPVTI